jgi:hypothetical protein
VLALRVAAVAGLGQRGEEGVDRRPRIRRRKLVGVGQRDRAHQTIGADAGLAGKIVEEQQALHAAIGADLETGAIDRERIGSGSPGPVGINAIIAVVAVVETDREHPVRRRRRRRFGRGGEVDEIGRAVAVKYLAQIGLGVTDSQRPVSLVRRGQAETVAVLMAVDIKGRITFVVEGSADAPLENVAGIGGIGDVTIRTITEYRDNATPATRQKSAARRRAPRPRGGRKNRPTVSSRPRPRSTPRIRTAATATCDTCGAAMPG